MPLSQEPQEKIPEPQEKSLPPPWDRIFSLATRAFVWGLLLSILYLLRPFLLLIFLTFVFAYIQAHGVEGLQHRIKNRPLRVTLVALVFLGTLLATGFTLFPLVREQAVTFWQNRHKYADDADREINKSLEEYPSVYKSLLERSAVIEKLREKQPNPDGQLRGKDYEVRIERGQDGQFTLHFDEKVAQALRNIGRSPDETSTAVDPGSQPRRGAPGPAKNGQDPPPTRPDDEKLHPVRNLLDNVGNDIGDNAVAFGQSVLGYLSSFLLSLLFSFL